MAKVPHDLLQGRTTYGGNQYEASTLSSNAAIRVGLTLALASSLVAD